MIAITLLVAIPLIIGSELNLKTCVIACLEIVEPQKQKELGAAAGLKPIVRTNIGAYI